MGNDFSHVCFGDAIFHIRYGWGIAKCVEGRTFRVKFTNTNEVEMKKELKSLVIKLQVSNMRTERLIDNINTAKELLGQYENCLTEELKTSNVLANKIELELLMDDAITAQTE